MLTCCCPIFCVCLFGEHLNKAAQRNEDELWLLNCLTQLCFLHPKQLLFALTLRIVLVIMPGLFIFNILSCQLISRWNAQFIHFCSIFFFHHYDSKFRTAGTHSVFTETLDKESVRNTAKPRFNWVHDWICQAIKNNVMNSQCNRLSFICKSEWI